MNARKEENKKEDRDNLPKEDKKLEGQGQPGSKVPKNGSRSRRKNGKRDSKGGGQQQQPGNDPSWYELTPEIAKKTANFYYGYLPGFEYPLSMKFLDPSGPVTYDSKTYIPSIMAIDYFPSFGTSTSKVSGINMAATQLYTWYRQANSGARNYEAPDLMMYCLAMEDALSTWFYIRRCLQAVKFMPRENRNYPRALAHAMCFDYDDAVENYALYCARLNLLTVKFNSWAIPAEFDAIKRAIYVNSQVFTDSDSIRGQAYVFVKQAYYQFDGKTSSTGSKLSLKKFGVNTGTWDIGTPATIGTMLDQLDECLTALYYDEDITIMSGDTLKAFKDKLVTLPEFVPEREQLSLVFDPDVLAQIENMTFTSLELRSTTWDTCVGLNFDYIQGSGQIECNPMFLINESSKGDFPAVIKDRILNSRKDDPTYSDNLEWTRLMPTYDLLHVQTGTPDEAKDYIQITSCGLEIPVELRLISNVKSGGTVAPTTTTSILSTVYASTIPALNDLIVFDWHPIMYVSTGGSIKPLGDIKFPTVVADSVLQSLNDAAQQAVFSRKVKGSNEIY